MNIVQKTNYITEKEYRGLKDRLSYSALKTFDDNRIKFYKKFILGEQVEEDPLSNDMLNGSLVDCMLFTPQDFDKKFVIATVDKPVGQMGELCDVLIYITTKYSEKVNFEDEFSDIVVYAEFSKIFEEALDKMWAQGKFKGKDLSKVLDLFNADATAEQFYEEGRSAIGKVLASINQVNYAQKLADDALNCQYEAGEILRARSHGNIEVINQLPILCDFGILSLEHPHSVPFKALLDKIIIDHENRLIKKYDLKVTWEAEGFDYNFLKMKYYLQLGSYDVAFRHWVVNERPDLVGYHVEPLAFIALDSKGVSIPLVYETNEDWSFKAISGFKTTTGRRYKGVMELITEIQHHLETGNWLISKQNHIDYGITQIKKVW
jgi:hypothetical protein